MYLCIDFVNYSCHFITCEHPAASLVNEPLMGQFAVSNFAHFGFLLAFLLKISACLTALVWRTWKIWLSFISHARLQILAWYSYTVRPIMTERSKRQFWSRILQNKTWRYICQRRKSNALHWHRDGYKLCRHEFDTENTEWILTNLISNVLMLQACKHTSVSLSAKIVFWITF